MEIKVEEVGWFGFVSMLMGIGLTLIGIFWDVIAGVGIRHSEGLGWMQVVWISFWTLYSFWAWAIHIKWHEYQKQIHGLVD